MIEAPRDTDLPITDLCVYDVRVSAWRAEACAYADIIMALHSAAIPYDDQARRYAALQLHRQSLFPPRDYQRQAIDAWNKARRRGVIVLPTGTGKSFVAQMAMELSNRSTLVVVPTIDLMEQWASQLKKAFGLPVGLLGGGSKDVQD
ncbi:MAG: DEAD/DEAH box helicase family protein, partial [Victivallales bacterium]|nr:DEAD/DEAH box helicase family protein [Victivallales bacterium]